MKSIFASVVLCVASASAYASDVQLPQRASSAEGFVPAGWRLHAQASGDLDGDGRADLALVIQNTDPANIHHNTNGLGAPSWDENPRVLIVALADGNGFRRVAQASGFVPSVTNPVMDDPFAQDGIVASGMAIKDRVLSMQFGFWASAGTWSMFTKQWKLRWQVQRGCHRQCTPAMYLIGFDYSHLHRGSGGMREVSVNYLNSRTGQCDSSIEEDHCRMRAGPPVNTRTLLRLDQLGDGLSGDIPGIPAWFLDQATAPEPEPE